MGSTVNLFNPPARSRRHRATSSTRSLRSISSRRSSSRAPATPVYSDLIGMKTAHMPQLTHQESPTLKFPSAVSIASKSSSTSSGSTDTNASTNTTASSVAEMVPLRRPSEAREVSGAGVTPHDLFGTRVPLTEAEMAPSAPDAVQLASGAYRVPGPIDKGFYRDLTFLEDEELTQKYGLIKVDVDDRPRTAPAEGSSRKAHRRTMLSSGEVWTMDVVKFV